MAKTTKTADARVHSLTSLEVREVSIVDKPANGRRFSMIKSEDGADMPDEIEVNLDENTVVDPAAETTPAPVKKTLFVEGAFDEIEKSLSVNDEMKTEAYKVLRKTMMRIETAMYTMQMSDTTESTEATEFSSLIGKELLEVGASLSSLGKKLGGKKSVNKNDTGEGWNSSIALLETHVETAILAEVEAVEKAGAKMSKGRLETLEVTVGNLTKLLGELKGSNGLAATEKAELTKSLTDATEERAELRATIAKQATALKKFQTAVQPSGALNIETENAEGPSEATVWPRDMNLDGKKVDDDIDFSS